MMANSVSQSRSGWKGVILQMLSGELPGFLLGKQGKQGKLGIKCCSLSGVASMPFIEIVIITCYGGESLTNIQAKLMIRFSNFCKSRSWNSQSFADNKIVKIYHILDYIFDCENHLEPSMKNASREFAINLQNPNLTWLLF